ncbi:MAG: transcription termination factor NusA [Nitrospirota bacterium]
MKTNLIAVIEQLGREKGIESETIINVVESALLTAAKKRYGQFENIQVKVDPETGAIELISLKTIVESVSDPNVEVSLEEAKKVDADAEVGDEIGSLIEMEEFGRIAAQIAKQVIFQKVREAEWNNVVKEYSVKKGEIINGFIMGHERKNYIVNLGKTDAILPLNEQIHGEIFRNGDRVKGYLLDVRNSSKGPQIILSRTHPNFVAKLFEMETPEIYEGIVEIKGIVREPGDRTKISVSSNDSAVDPVGACVGVKGSRVQAVVRELRGEKIDIITWTADPRIFIGEALSPAIIEKVGINEEKKIAVVVVSPQQLSLAIGKKGQNVRLAAKLTGWKVDIIKESDYENEIAREKEEEIKEGIKQGKKEEENMGDGNVDIISKFPGMGEKIAEILRENGFDVMEKIAAAKGEDIEKLPMIGKKTAEKLLSIARDWVKRKERNETEKV